MTSGPSLRLRPATPEDRFLIRRWLSDPAVQLPWDSAAGAQAEVTLAMDSTAALPRMVERDGSPIGYAHAVEIGLWSDPRPQEVSAGTWDVRYFIVPGADDPVQIGGAVLELLCDEVFATTLAVACSSVVSITNEPAARACERAGFRWLRVLNDPTAGPSWLMLRERPIRPQAR
jgi:aminoglycoside 6'-N-acetyltransferase